MRCSLCISALSLAIAFHAATLIEARPTYVQRIPNSSAVPGVRALGHQNRNGGGAANVFGEAFEAAGAQWTPELCESDSDGDGATNGEELGDPCCTWQPSGAVSRTTAISHPGEANSFSATELAMMRCAAAGTAEDVATSTTSPTVPPQPIEGPMATTAAPGVAAEAPVAVNGTTPSVAPSTSTVPLEKTPAPMPPSEQDRGTTATPASGASAFNGRLINQSVMAMVMILASAVA